MDEKEFTKHLLNSTKVDLDEVFEWAIWKKICSLHGVTLDYAERRKLINQMVEKEVDKWFGEEGK